MLTTLTYKMSDGGFLTVARIEPFGHAAHIVVSSEDEVLHDRDTVVDLINSEQKTWLLAEYIQKTVDNFKGCGGDVAPYYTALQMLL